tara:strand:- start:402 stop:644 length:243 start_codon:yes stop_codon:yes gene_type:complete
LGKSASCEPITLLSYEVHHSYELYNFMTSDKVAFCDTPLKNELAKWLISKGIETQCFFGMTGQCFFGMVGTRNVFKRRED